MDAKLVQSLAALAEASDLDAFEQKLCDTVTDLFGCSFAMTTHGKGEVFIGSQASRSFAERVPTGRVSDFKSAPRDLTTCLIPAVAATGRCFLWMCNKLPGCGTPLAEEGGWTVRPDGGLESHEPRFVAPGFDSWWMRQGDHPDMARVVALPLYPPLGPATKTAVTAVLCLVYLEGNPLQDEREEFVPRQCRTLGLLQQFVRATAAIMERYLVRRHAYVDQGFLDNVLASPGLLEGTVPALRWGVYVYGDMRGYSTLSAGLQPYPGVLREFTARFYDMIADEVRATGGFTNKFVGDGFLALYGCLGDAITDAGAQRDTVGRALEGARRVVGRFEGESLDWLRHSLRGSGSAAVTDPGLGIGVNLGSAVLGPIGAHEFTAIGHEVNVAGKLSKKADSRRHTPILVTKGIRDLAVDIAGLGAAFTGSTACLAAPHEHVQLYVLSKS